MKLTDLLKEIVIKPPGRSILWGMTDDNRFTELVKLNGFKTSQEALDEINTAFPNEDPYELESDAYNPSYAYLAGDGRVTFVKDLSEFGRGYETEEGWGVDEWSKNPPQ
jgi:hypothetical protein